MTREATRVSLEDRLDRLAEVLVSAIGVAFKATCAVCLVCFAVLVIFRG